uniref:hypothetical protein n=1 Tax=Alistipes sp. TaxID=1872444 RepID=UPI0040562991
MSKRAKLALLALLGFSTACSTVRQSGSNQDAAAPETIEQGEPSIRVLYGVRPPVREVPEEQGSASNQE